MAWSCYAFGLAALVFLFSCHKRQQNPLLEKQEALKKFALKNPGTKIYWADSVESSVVWRVNSMDQIWVEGTLKPEGGCLVENEVDLIGGFMQLGWTKQHIATDVNYLKPEEARKILLSQQVMPESKNKSILFELKTAIRQVERGDIYAHLQQDGSTHMLTGNLTLNDSTRQFSLPVAIVKTKQGVAVNGKTELTYTDFGIRFGTPTDSISKWKLNSQVAITIKLKLNELKLTP